MVVYRRLKRLQPWAGYVLVAPDVDLLYLDKPTDTYHQITAFAIPLVITNAIGKTVIFYGDGVNILEHSFTKDPEEIVVICKMPIGEVILTWSDLTISVSARQTDMYHSPYDYDMTGYIWQQPRLLSVGGGGEEG